MKFNKVSPPCRIIDCDVADWVPDAGSEGHARVPRHPRSRAHRVPEGPGQLACGRLVHRRVAHVEDERAGQTFRGALRSRGGLHEAHERVHRHLRPHAHRGPASLTCVIYALGNHTGAHSVPALSFGSSEGYNLTTRSVREFIDTFVPASARSTAVSLTHTVYALGNCGEALFGPAVAFGDIDGYNPRTRCGRVSSAPSSSCSPCARGSWLTRGRAPGPPPQRSRL